MRCSVELSDTIRLASRQAPTLRLGTSWPTTVTTCLTFADAINNNTCKMVYVLPDDVPPWHTAIRLSVL